MPRNQFQRMIFALLTVVITVHAYVFYSLYVVNGEALMAGTGASGVLEALRRQGGVYLCGTHVPIWACILIEFCFAYLLEVLIGSPASFRLACRVFNPAKNHPMIFETAIICATVGIMCPAMSLIAAFLYYPYAGGFHVLTLLANWLKLICVNFPFAYFTQLFLIQPVVRVLFRTLFHRDIAQREQQKEERLLPENEQEVIFDIFRRIDEIQEEIAHEHRRRKALEEDVHQMTSR